MVARLISILIDNGQTVATRFDQLAPRRVKAVASLIMVLITVVTILGPSSAGAASTSGNAAAQPALNHTEAVQLLDTLNDPEKRARLIANLDAMVRLDHSDSAQQTAATAAPTAAPSSTSVQATVSEWLRLASAHVKTAVVQFSQDFRSITDLPALTRWMRAKFTIHSERELFIEGAWRIVVTFLTTIVTFLTMRYLVARWRLQGSAALSITSAGAGTHATVRRVLGKLAGLIIASLIGNFFVIFLLADFPIGRSVAFALVNAYVGLQLLLSVIDEVMRLSKKSPEGHAQARVLSGRWRTLLVIVVCIIALEFVAGDVLGELGASGRVAESVQKLLALVAHGVLILMVLASRVQISAWLHRQSRPNSALSAILDAVAALWPTIAIITIAGSWLVWAMDIPDTYKLIVRVVVATAGVLLVSRTLGSIALDAFDRRFTTWSGASRNTVSGRLAGYHRSARTLVRLGVVILTILALTEAWGVGSLSWFGAGHVGHRVVGLFFQLLILIFLGVACWEAADLAFEKRVTVLMESASIARATRLRTLQPIIRLALIVLILLVVIMTALNAVGINVGPLLAGAGILGVALGFGSQKLVQDFITGIFLLVEDAVDVGDWVTVAGLSGSVEHISIRTIRLRAGDGSVHLIPFSAVTSVTNTNRGIGNAAVAANIDPREDTDQVAAILTDIAVQMRQDPEFSNAMQSDLQLWGVDKVDGAMTTIAGQIVCTDAGRWPVQREFNRRMKKRFEQEGISLAIPQQTVRVERFAGSNAALANAPVGNAPVRAL